MAIVLYVILIGMYTGKLIVLSLCCFKDAGLYNKLYLCLFDLVADLIRLANGDSIVQ